jgi:hypothetical protein
MVALKPLAQYYDAAADRRILDFMERYFAYQRRELANRPVVTGDKRAARKMPWLFSGLPTVGPTRNTPMLPRNCCASQ